MAKNYDRLEWNFIKNTRTCMGFPNNLINIIMHCISSVSYSILINSNPTNTFHPSRVIRQGDPFSPYLFILFVEVLSGSFSTIQEKSLTHGLPMAKNAPTISHTLYEVLFGLWT